MSTNIIENVTRTKWLLHPAWWAVVNLLVSLYGILFLNWHIQPLVYLFWIEVILSIAAALIRVIGAMDGQPFMATLGRKIFALLFGSVMGIGFIMLTVAFTFNAFHNGLEPSGFGDIRWQMLILLLNYIAALLLHYFLNGKYKTAAPIGELASTFVRLLFLLCIIMVITQHLLPKYPALDAAVWTAVAIVALKFIADWIASRKSLEGIRQEISTIEHEKA